MKAIIKAVSPLGFEVGIEIEEESLNRLAGKLADVSAWLLDHGYETTGELPPTPDGLPVCRRHREVMRRREKQGDEWFSHTVIGPDGQALYCKGRPGKDSPGWEY